MKFLTFILIIIVLIVIYYSEGKNINAKKDRKVLLFILAIASVLAGIVIFFPNIPGPSEWIEFIFKPLNKS